MKLAAAILRRISKLGSLLSSGDKARLTYNVVKAPLKTQDSGSIYDYAIACSLNVYNDLLERGIARELARAVLTTSDLHDFLYDWINPQLG